MSKANAALEGAWGTRGPDGMITLCADEPTAQADARLRGREVVYWCRDCGSWAYPWGGPVAGPSYLEPVS